MELPPWGYVAALPALILSGMMFGALGMLLSSTIKQLENFAGVMNFVIFPMFFASSALYPLWKMSEGSLWLYYICLFNPFTYAVELIRFAFYMEVNWQALAVVVGMPRGVPRPVGLGLRPVLRHPAAESGRRRRGRLSASANARGFNRVAAFSRWRNWRDSAGEDRRR